MAKRMKVTHAEGVDILGEVAVSVEEGILLVFTDQTKTVLIKAYNREVWAFAEFVEVDGEVRTE
ncbi:MULTISPECIES: hypothetical protein [Rhodococcus]|jgi:hypothetical protein|uniref:hypothetical protein n=1 Tax=Rhodococcus TaxID=1827 RepID=UPI000BB3B4E5|nr:hypothetical protein [Rhodococcus erythropolis]PBI96943.1 hypothetical protein BKP42_36030 [Rhodococcus erythropolis]